MRRSLKQDALKPWQYQSWIFLRDPASRPKAARVLDLYTRTFDGTALSEDEYVISADERTSIQAPGRCEPLTGIVPFTCHRVQGVPRPRSPPTKRTGVSPT
ncbi:hypothetical protein [Streptomyces mirabilis]|uniref:hypothetical protein n=1 Tax=Streptomyces mirabilis TaxID=68239 RepID=UPI003646E14A